MSPEGRIPSSMKINSLEPVHLIVDVQSHTHTHTQARTHTHIFAHVCTVILSLNFLAQLGSTALLLASLGGSVKVVRMLLEEFNSSLDEVDNVSVYFTICITALKQPL